MIVKVWGIVNDQYIDFQLLPDRVGYWYGICPRVPGLQDIECWAENDKGGRGHLKCQMYISWVNDTIARLVLIPIEIKLLKDFYSVRTLPPISI